MFGVTFSQDGSELLTYSGWTMQRWQVATGQLESTFEMPAFEEGGINTAIFSPDNQTIISRHDSAIRLWDTASGKPIKTLTKFTGYIEPTFFTPDGTSLIAYDSGFYIADGNGGYHLDRQHHSEIRVWNVKTWQQTALMRGHTAMLNSVELSPDGATLVSTGAFQLIAARE